MRPLIVTAPSRVHFSLLQLSREFSNFYGGLGVAIASPCWTLEVNITDAQDKLIGFDGEFDAYVKGLLARIRERFNIGPLKVKVCTSVPSHVGLGSKTSLGCAVLAAICDLGSPRVDWSRHRKLLHRGGASGIGINVAVVGGLVLDAGHPSESVASLLPSCGRPGQAVPSVIARWSPNFLPAPLLARPPGITGLHSAEEISFWRQHMPIDASFAAEVATVLMYELLPSIARKDARGWLRGIQALQACGLKKLEWEVQPEPCHILRSAAFAAGALAVALSSMGPTMMIFAEDPERVAMILRATVGAEVAQTKFAEVGVTIGRSPLREASE